MKTLPILILFTSASICAHAQGDLSEQEINAKLDSILVEGDRLFQYEKAAWISTELTLGDPDLGQRMAGFLVHQKEDTVISVILDQERNCIREYMFVPHAPQPISERTVQRVLTEDEEGLLSTREKIIANIIAGDHGIGAPEGFSLNQVLFPVDGGYRFYIMTGTSQRDMIPFGNDHLFLAGPDGEILSSRKFHTRLIPTETQGPEGEEVTMISHSHLKTEPFISATDICTFKLYGPLYGLEEFSVYSPSMSRYFVYNATTDRITMRDKH